MRFGLLEERVVEMGRVRDSVPGHVHHERHNISIPVADVDKRLQGTCAAAGGQRRLHKLRLSV